MTETHGHAAGQTASAVKGHYKYIPIPGKHSDHHEEKKKLIVVDTNLHVQDPEDIILSYFNTQGSNQFVEGKRSSYLNKIMGLFIAITFLKFFFEERLTNVMMFITVAIVAAIVGFLVSRGITYMVEIVHRSSINDSLRGISYQLVFITLLVLVIGAFI